ncbi:Caspase domain containing protein [Rhabdaerophilaceae bacterium]
MCHSGRRLPHGVAAILVSLLIFALPGSRVMAQGMQRLGFVVGLADYPDRKHPTALGDASLVASALKSAGFALTEGANMSDAEFRAAFRSFLDLANAAGPDAVIAFYVSGFAVQDEGETYLVPPAARLRQRADLATEALRLSDFLRAMAGLPSRSRIVMIDAGYQNPYLALVADGPRGMALPEQQEGVILAFNTSPGQASPLPRTAYGPYAMALAEALQEPSLDINAAFERARLRTHDLSGGTDTPFVLNGLADPLILFAGQAIAPGPLETPAPSNPADEAYARAVALDTIRGYEGFLADHPTHPQAKRVLALLAGKREAAYWQRTRRTNTEGAYWSYLKYYPRGGHAAEARRRLSRFTPAEAPPANFVEMVYDDLLPPRDDEIEVYETIVVEEAWEVLPAPFVAPVALLPPPPVAIVDLPPPTSGFDARYLAAVPLAVGAGVIAHRLWKRPQRIHPTYSPPPPVRSPLREGFVSPRPGYVQPLTRRQSNAIVAPSGGNQDQRNRQPIQDRPGAIRAPVGTPGIPPNVPIVRPPVQPPVDQSKLPPPPSQPVRPFVNDPGQKPGSLPVVQPAQPLVNPRIGGARQSTVPEQRGRAAPVERVRPVPSILQQGNERPRITPPTAPRRPGEFRPRFDQGATPRFQPPPPSYRPPPGQFRPGPASPPPGRAYQPQPQRNVQQPFRQQPEIRPLQRPIPPAPMMRPQAPQPVFRAPPPQQRVAPPAPRPALNCPEKARLQRMC